MSTNSEPSRVLLHALKINNFVFDLYSIPRILSRRQIILKIQVDRIDEYSNSEREKDIFRFIMVNVNYVLSLINRKHEDRMRYGSTRISIENHPLVHVILCFNKIIFIGDCLIFIRPTCSDSRKMKIHNYEDRRANRLVWGIFGSGEKRNLLP